MVKQGRPVTPDEWKRVLQIAGEDIDIENGTGSKKVRLYSPTITYVEFLDFMQRECPRLTHFLVPPDLADSLRYFHSLMHYGKQMVEARLPSAVARLDCAKVLAAQAPI